MTMKEEKIQGDLLPVCPFNSICKERAANFYGVVFGKKLSTCMPVSQSSTLCPGADSSAAFTI